MATYTLSDVISKSYTSTDPQDPTIFFEFPDVYTGTQADAEAYAEGLLNGNPDTIAALQAQIATLTADLATSQAETAAEVQKKQNIIDAYNTADASTDQAILDNS